MKKKIIIAIAVIVILAAGGFFPVCAPLRAVRTSASSAGAC